jgi:ankyrin repeat protein
MIDLSKKHNKLRTSFRTTNIVNMSEGGNNISQIDALLDLQHSKIKQLAETKALLELSKLCHSESLSEDSLRAIFERHGCAQNNNNDPNINYIFYREACRNEKVTEGILRCLLEYFPNAARYADGNLAAYAGAAGRLPLHIICFNKNVTLGMVNLLIDAFPSSVSHEDNEGLMPLHYLCHNKNLGEDVGLEILKLLLERFPEAVKRRTTEKDKLPIHYAATWQSPEFCRRLIEAYPGSERTVGNLGALPFHCACTCNTVATVEYLYQLHPESINLTDRNGFYPINYVFLGLENRSIPKDGVEVVRFLLECNPGVALQKNHSRFPFYWVCKDATNGDASKLNLYLKILQMLYDAHPEAIERNEVKSKIDSFCTDVQTFINDQLSYARQARDQALMTTRDENGQLPLHRALHNKVALGSIKLLVKGNPSAACTFDIRGMIPLHVACQHHETPAVVEYLIGLDEVTLTTADREGNTALHHACIGANHAMIALLLDNYGSMFVSKRNAKKQLPIELLLENKNEVSDNESVEYTESIYWLLRAYPETIMISI